MIDARIIALTLLIGRIVSVVVFLSVIRTQLRLMRMPTEPEVVKFRKSLFILTLIITVGNIVPILIDTVGIMGGPKPIAISELIIWYAASNCITALLAAVLVRKLYRLASDTKETTDFETRQLKKLK